MELGFKPINELLCMRQSRGVGLQANQLLDEAVTKSSFDLTNELLQYETIT